MGKDRSEGTSQWVRGKPSAYQIKATTKQGALDALKAFQASHGDLIAPGDLEPKQNEKGIFIIDIPLKVG